MVVNDRIAELIRESRADELPAAMQDGAYYDMQTLTQALIELDARGARRPRDGRRTPPPTAHDFLLALSTPRRRSRRQRPSRRSARSRWRPRTGLPARPPAAAPGTAQ